MESLKEAADCLASAESVGVIALPWSCRPALFTLEHLGLLPDTVQVHTWKPFKAGTDHNGQIYGYPFFFDREERVLQWRVDFVEASNA
jgi:hypothetical protein